MKMLRHHWYVKIPKASNGKLAEKDCNQRVISGDYQFMLDALKAVDCPSCAYGILGN